MRSPHYQEPTIWCNKPNSRTQPCVRIQEYSSRALVAGRESEVPKLFGLAFGTPYLDLLEFSLGEEISVLEIWWPGDKPVLVALFPFSAESTVRASWSSRIEELSPQWARTVCDDDMAVVMDFCVISPLWRGSAIPCFRVAALELASQGFRYAFTEVQWLRQLVLWMRAGWRLTCPNNHDPKAKLRKVGKSVRSGHGACGLLDSGERFIYHDEPVYAGGRLRWNVVLATTMVLVQRLAAQDASAGLSVPR